MVELQPLVASAGAAALVASFGCMWLCGVASLTTIFIAAVGTAIGLACGGVVTAMLVQDQQQRRAANKAKAAEVAEKAWDYIIVGGGAAGCTLAARLSSSKAGEKKSVLVLEAGTADYDANIIKMPAGVLRTFQSDYDWHFQSKDETATAGRSIYLCRGKVLGGSSCLCVCLYNRGDARDYDIWESEYGCKGWKAEDVITDFTRTEDDNTGAIEKNSKYHGKGGELAVEQVRYQNPLSEAYLRACEQAGLPRNDDFNDWSKKQDGAGRFTVMERGGVRCSAATAFASALGEKERSVEVLTEASVRKIVFDGNKAATGVKFRVCGHTHVAKLAEGGEVILAGGAIHSPQLLMLSGIGPADHLQEHGIAVVSDVPAVGQNLQDHPAAVVSYSCPESQKGVSVTSKIRIPGTTMPHPLPLLQWFFTGSGPYTSTGCDHGGFFRTSAASSASPDLQMRFLAAQAVAPDGMSTFTNYKKTANHPDGFSFQSIAARPVSTGRVRLASGDPDEQPVVQTGFLSDKRDVATIREGLKLSRKIASQPAFKEYLGKEVFPGADVKSDQQLDDYIARSVHTANAIVGTCRMGAADDVKAVVDPDLRVKGVTGLRVIDSSVMPRLPGGQTVSSTMMIAEKGADIVRRGR